MEIRRRSAGKQKGQLYQVYITPQGRQRYTLILGIPSDVEHKKRYLNGPLSYSRMGLILFDPIFEHLGNQHFTCSVLRCHDHIRKDAASEGFKDPDNLIKAARKRWLGVTKAVQVHLGKGFLYQG